MPTWKDWSIAGWAVLACACGASDGKTTTGTGAGGAGGSVTGADGGATATGGATDVGAGGAFPGGGTGSGGAPAGGATASGGTATASGGTATASGGAAGGDALWTGCEGLTIPKTTDYGAMGPYVPQTITGSGPDGQYTMIHPQDLGASGTRHPIATWGNGITTTPAAYPGLLNTIASNGFVIIASNSTNVTAQLVTAGLDWLIAQNTAAGDLQGRLEPKCAVTIGYSLGGGAAVNAGNHDGVVATVSWHGLQGASQDLRGPLLLFTSTADGFVTKAGYVKPTYDASTKVPTIMATLNVPGAPADFAGHLKPINDAGEERAPAVAWLRLWVYGDQDAKAWFYGPDCLLCKDPWTDIQRKNAAW